VQLAGKALRGSSDGGVLGGGAAKTLAELYSARAAECIRLAYLMTGDPDGAEDIVQEAFARIYARHRTRRPPSQLEPYLRRTIVNLTRDRHRRHRTSRAYLERAAVAPPEDRGHQVDSQIDFRVRLQALPHRQRAALVLRYYEDLSEQATAEVLNCSAAAVKQLVQRGLNALRRDLQGEPDV
jgi:RNA polymerase sigma-70 factor (sigma-E family)